MLLCTVQGNILHTQLRGTYYTQFRGTYSAGCPIFIHIETELWALAPREWVKKRRALGILVFQLVAHLGAAGLDRVGKHSGAGLDSVGEDGSQVSSACSILNCKEEVNVYCVAGFTRRHASIIMYKGLSYESPQQRIKSCFTTSYVDATKSSSTRELAQDLPKILYKVPRLWQPKSCPGSCLRSWPPV